MEKFRRCWRFASMVPDQGERLIALVDQLEILPNTRPRRAAHTVGRSEPSLHGRGPVRACAAILRLREALGQARRRDVLDLKLRKAETCYISEAQPMRRAGMKYLSIALAISFGMGMVLFGLVYPIFHDAHLAAGIAAMPIAGCHHIAEMLERREMRHSVTARRPTEIQSLEGFTISWSVAVVYATLALFAIDLFAGVFGASVIMFLFGTETAATKTQVIGVLLVATPMVLAGGFVVGRWIGSRCAGWSRATILLVAALAPLLSHGLDWSLSRDSTPVLEQTEMQDFLITTLVSFCSFAASGLLGHRYGREHRLAKYVEHLLSVLPPQTRSVLVELAYEEARKAGAATGGAPAMREQ